MDDLPELKPALFVQRGLVKAAQIVENIRVNAGRLLPQADFKRVCICGSGPSLFENLHIVKKLHDLGFAIASMNGSHNFLIENGITPDYHFQIDARKGVNLPFLRLANGYTTYVIASQCDPEIFEALAGRKVMLWQVDNYEGAGDAIRKLSPEATVFGGANNVGQSCLSVIAALGFRIWHIVGFDGPTRDGQTHAFDQPQNDGDEMQDFYFQGQKFRGSPTMAQDAQAFVERYKLLRAMGMDIHIYGNDLLPTMVKALAPVQGPHGRAPVLMPAMPRRKPADKMRVVLWKWEGHIPYTAAHVNSMAQMLDRWLGMPAEIVCVTDNPDGIDGSVRIVPMWRDNFEYGRDWHRLKVFLPEMDEILGPRFLSLDLDTVITGPLHPLLEHDVPFKAWRDPFRLNQYCTAMFMMDTGAFPHVYNTFSAREAIKLRESGRFSGYDQAWISATLPGRPVWTQDDGVMSFKADVLRSEVLPAGPVSLPPETRIVHFHGRFDPRQEDVRAACPWIDEFYPR